jgi:hypothetical protein
MSSASSSNDHTSTGTGAGSGEEVAHKAGAFDIRVFIASLIGIYGVVLVIAGLIGPSDSQLAKAGGVNINLWAGLGMVVVSAVFVTWARLRPVVVPEHVDTTERPPGAH